MQLNFSDTNHSPNHPKVLKRTSTKLLSRRKFSKDVAYEVWRGKILDACDEDLMRIEKLQEMGIMSGQLTVNSRRINLSEQNTLYPEDVNETNGKNLSQSESSTDDQYKNSYSHSILKFKRCPKRKCNSILNKLTHLLFRKKMYNPNCKNGSPKCNCNADESVKGYINFQDNIYQCSFRKE